MITAEAIWEEVLAVEVKEEESEEPRWLASKLAQSMQTEGLFSSPI